MAGEYEHIKGKGNRFSSTNQPENRGGSPNYIPSPKKPITCLVRNGMK